MAKKTIPKKIKKQVYDFISVLRKDELPITKVLVFGSCARGDKRCFSDIDLCVVSPKFKNSFDSLQYLWLKRKEVSNSEIEPIGFSPKDFNENTSLTKEIKRTGIEIKV